MITITTTATVQYSCILTAKDEKAFMGYIEREGLELNELDSADMVEIACSLYEKGEINLYARSTESDFCTESIDMVEID